MRQFWTRTRPGLMALLFPLLVCACSRELDPKDRLGTPAPPGVIGQNDPRWKGIPEESGDEKGGILSKKVYRKPDKN